MFYIITKTLHQPNHLLQFLNLGLISLVVVNVRFWVGEKIVKHIFIFDIELSCTILEIDS